MTQLNESDAGDGPSLKPALDLLSQAGAGQPEFQGPDGAMLSLQGKAACVVWTCEEWTKLCGHLHNDNGPMEFIMGFRTDGAKKYVRSKNLRFSKSVSWGWASIQGRSKSPLAYVPYSTNKDRRSRWGALDFDAHDGDHERARRFAFGAFHLLLTSNLFVILESSGQGWHVWVISKDFHPVNEWVRLLKRIVEAINAPIQSGICEIFPPDTLSNGFGKGMRAPGSWNPGTETLNEIFWQNTEELLPSLRTQLTDIKRNYSFSSSSFSSPLPPQLYKEWENRWSKRFSITSRSTRNKQLTELVGVMFHQVGFAMAERIVEAQFTSKTVKTAATREKHLESFKECWKGLHEKWLAGLGDKEKQLLQSLHTENERDGFRIIRSYHRKSLNDQQPDFAVAAENLGARLGMTLAGASAMRKKFEASGIIKLTQPFQPNKRAARYKWLALQDDLGVPPLDSNQPF